MRGTHGVFCAQSFMVSVPTVTAAAVADEITCDATWLRVLSERPPRECILGVSSEQQLATPSALDANGAGDARRPARAARADLSVCTRARVHTINLRKHIEESLVKLNSISNRIAIEPGHCSLIDSAFGARADTYARSTSLPRGSPSLPNAGVAPHRRGI
jgi:hypothetical protein